MCIRDRVGERILQLVSGVFHVAFAICGKAEDIGQVAVDVTGVDGLEPLAVPLREQMCIRDSGYAGRSQQARE